MTARIQQLATFRRFGDFDETIRGQLVRTGLTSMSVQPKTLNGSPVQSSSEVDWISPDQLHGIDRVIVVAGIGSRQWSQFAPVLLEAVREKGIPIFAVVALPPGFELIGETHLEATSQRLVELGTARIFAHQLDGHQYSGRFLPASQQCIKLQTARVIRTLIEMEASPGPIKVDMREVQHTIGAGVSGAVGQGNARGTNRVRQAVDQALASRLLGGNSPTSRATAAIVVLHSNGSLGLDECAEVQHRVEGALRSNARLVMSSVHDPHMAPDQLRATVILVRAMTG